MTSFLHISPEKGSDQGGGPDDNNQFPTRTLRSHGFLALAFGFAMGLTFVIFFFLFRITGAPTSDLARWVSSINPNLWFSFIFGLIAGTLLAGIYNFLIFRRINLFGLDRNLD